MNVLNVHDLPVSSGDHKKFPWLQTARREVNGKPIYSCSFNSLAPGDVNSLFATVSERFTHVYECSINSADIRLMAMFCSSSLTESLYATAWCFDTYEYSRGANPYFLAYGGENAIIYIVDVYNQKLVNRLTSHGGAINEIRTCPSMPNIIASASKDKTVRVFHIRNQTCLIVCGGHTTHVDQILSLDWSLCGSKIISCGMDHTILMWDMSAKNPKSIIENACKKLQDGRRNILKVSKHDIIGQYRLLSDIKQTVKSETNENDKNNKSSDSYNYKLLKDTIDEMTCKNGDGVYYALYWPIARNSDLHIDYVDTVRFFGNTEYIFSKGCGKESVIYMSRFYNDKDKLGQLKPFEVQHGSIKFTERNVPNGETWFIRFEIDPLNKWLVCGDNCGNLHFWDLHDLARKTPVYTINIGRLPVRDVSFGLNGRVLIAVSEDGTISRLDRIHSGIREVPNFKIVNISNNGMPRAKKVKKVTQEETASMSEDDDMDCTDPQERQRIKARLDLDFNEMSD